MKNLTINLKDSEEKHHGTIRVHLDSDMPDECMMMLGGYICKAFEKWEDSIVKLS